MLKFLWSRQYEYICNTNLKTIDTSEISIYSSDSDLVYIMTTDKHIRIINIYDVYKKLTNGVSTSLKL